jgi:Protein of unknown function (DUF3987)
VTTTATPAPVKSILDDLLSDHPTYDYNVDQAGTYSQPLKTLLKARQYGLSAAQRTYESLEPIFAPILKVSSQNSSSNGAHTSPTTESGSMPQLPQNVQLPTGLLPQVSRWLDAYTQYSKRVSPEGYQDFHITCGLWVASTVAARRIYIPLANRVCTPLSIALVARTSLFAKTTTARAGTKLLRAAGLDYLLGNDETTPQKLLADMAGHVPRNFGSMSPEHQELVRLRMAMSGQLGWYYDEFNQLISAMMRPGPMAEFAGLLRKLDDCPDTYTYATRANDRETIEKPYLALLANTTPANLRKHASKGGEFWNDGFWARFIFLAPPPHNFITSTMDMGEVTVPGELSLPLQQWNQRLGVPACMITKSDEEGGTYAATRSPLPSTSVPIDADAYQAYVDYRTALREIVSTSNLEDLDGSYVRLPQTALRIAALITSLEDYQSITMPVWSLAQELAEMFRKNLHELYTQVTTRHDEESSLDETLIAYLKTLDEPKTVRYILQYGPADVRRLKGDGVRSMLLGLERDGITTVQREGKKEVWELKQEGGKNNG